MAQEFDKVDVLTNVAVEMSEMFDKLLNRYSKPEQVQERLEVEKIEAHMRAGFERYDPTFVFPEVDP